MKLLQLVDWVYEASMRTADLEFTSSFYLRLRFVPQILLEKHLSRPQTGEQAGGLIEATRRVLTKAMF